MVVAIDPVTRQQAHLIGNGEIRLSRLAADEAPDHGGYVQIDFYQFMRNGWIE